MERVHFFSFLVQVEDGSFASGKTGFASGAVLSCHRAARGKKIKPSSTLCDICLAAAWWKVSVMACCDTHHAHADFLTAHLLVFQILDLGGVVAVSLAVAEDLEPRHADGVNHRTAIWKELHVPYLKDSLQVCYLSDSEGEKGPCTVIAHIQKTGLKTWRGIHTCSSIPLKVSLSNRPEEDTLCQL